MDARNSLKVLSTEADLPQATELEVLLAEIENRLRRTILRIIRPTLDQTADIAARLASINQKVEHHEENLDACEQLRLDVKKQEEVTSVLKDQLSAQYDQTRNFEFVTTEHLTNLRSGNLVLEQKLEEHQSEIKRVSREGVRTNEEVERMRSELDNTTQKMYQDINGCFKVVDQNRNELLERVAQIDKARIDLIDDLFGEDKGITKIRHDIYLIQEFMRPLPEVEAGVADLVQKTGVLKNRQDDCEKFCVDAKFSYGEFTEHCEHRLHEMSEEFRKGMNELVAHHGSLLKVMRSDFAAELQASREMRSQITNVEGKTQQFCNEMAECVEAVSNRISATQRELAQDIEDLGKKRKKDRNAFDGELRDMKRDVSIQQEIVSSFHGSLAHFGRLMGLTLESQKIVSAMHVQDYADRCSERWLGLPIDLGRRAAPAHTADMVDKLPCRSGLEPSSRNAGNPTMHNLVPIDTKKGLLKVEYLPGPIAYGGKQYDRKDFVVLLDRLLQRAHSAFEKGPPKDPSAALSAAHLLPAVPSQPGARGGDAALAQAVSHGHSPARPRKLAEGLPDDDSEDPKSTAASSNMHRYSSQNGSRQRPGSRDQPQGTGSRGTMFGSLGETSPPDSAMALPHGVTPHSLPSGRSAGIRLPALAGGDVSDNLAVAEGAGASGHSTMREQPSANHTGKNRSSRFQAEEPADGPATRKCHTAR